jgi:hypothetical protein
MDITREWLLEQGFTELTGDRYEFKYEDTLSITIDLQVDDNAVIFVNQDMERVGPDQSVVLTTVRTRAEIVALLKLLIKSNKL